MRSFGVVLAFALVLAAAPAQAQSRSVGEVFRDCDDCPEMVVIPAGSFTMGSPPTEASRANDEGPQRRITFARDFAVGRFEVTRRQYAAFVRATGRADRGNCYTDRATRGTWARDPNGTWRDPSFSQGEDHPVVCVSWEDARAYVAWLNTETRGGYRLLSEAEWEYAARAGTMTSFVWGSDANAGCAFANGADAAARARYSTWATSTCNDGALYTAAAGSYAANAFGLSDLIGNVWEWTQDCYADSLDSVPSIDSPNETGACSIGLYRGGSWVNVPQYLRSANRNGNSPSFRVNDLGFRVARSVPGN